jgi:hypothetical protein
MRASLLAVAAATVLAAAIPSAPSFAQGVSVEVPGVGVRVGDPDRRRDRDVYRERRGDRVTVGSERRCKTVTVKERRPNGTTVIRKRSSCD